MELGGPRGRRRVRSIGSLVFGIASLMPPACVVTHAAVVNESEPNATAATADSLNPGAFGAGAISPTGDVDVWKTTGVNIFDLVFAYVDTTGSANTDSSLDLILNDTTTVLESDNDSGPSTSSAVAGAVVSQAGSLFYRVTENGNNGVISPYSLFQAVVSPEDVVAEVEGNDASDVANIVTAPVMTGAVSGADVDFYSFPVLGAPFQIVVIVDEDPDNDGVLTDTRVSILDKDGSTVLASGDDLPGNKANAAGAVASPSLGTYFVRIANGGGAPDTDYRFVVLVNGGPAFQHACCLPDGGCQDVPASQCSSVGGMFGGQGSRCATTACAQPIGACCGGDCSCEDRTEADCRASGGRWNGFGSTCATQNCAVTTFRDDTTFAAAASGLAVEDFEELPSGIASGCGTPIPGSSCFSPAQIVPGLVFDEPGPPPGISGIGAGFATFPRATSSDMICGGDAPDSLIVNLTAPGTRAVGMKVLALSTRRIDVSIEGVGGQALGTVTVFTDVVGTFLGLTSDVDLTRLVMTSPVGVNAVCLDDVAIGQRADGDGDGLPDTLACAGRCRGDGVTGCADNCPTVPNANQADTDDDAVGNTCDNCPAIENTDQADANGDGIGDACGPGIECELLGGKRLLLTSRVLKLLSTDTSLTLGRGAGSPDDPTRAGGTLRIVSDGGDGFDDTYALAADRWRAVRKGGTLRAFKLRPTTPFRSALIKAAKRIKVVAGGPELGHTLLTEPSAVDVVLTLGEHCYCMRFDRETTFKADRRWLATNAPPPRACPPAASPSGTFLDAHVGRD